MKGPPPESQWLPQVASSVGLRVREYTLILQLHKFLGFKPLDSSVIVSKRNEDSGVILYNG